MDKYIGIYRSISIYFLNGLKDKNRKAIYKETKENF